MSKEITEDTPLTPQEETFVHELIWNVMSNGGKAYKAYMTAYPKAAEKSAKSSSSALMKRPNIMKAIQVEQQKKIESDDISAKSKLKEIFQTLLNTTVADLYDDYGNALPLSELGQKAQIIDGVKKRYDGNGGYDIEYSLMPKEKIFDMLCKRFGLYEPEEAKVQINMPVVEVVAKIDNIETWNQNANE